MTTDTYVIGPTGKYTIQKDPDATLDYPFDWSQYLAPLADSIASVTWITSAGLTQSNPTHTPTKATIWLSGGVLGATEQCTCRITTAGGRTDDRTIYLKIVAK